MRKLNLLNHKFGRWTVTAPAEYVNGKTHWICKCECGTVKRVRTTSLRNGDTVSCGCYAEELKNKYADEEVDWTCPEYYVWSAMIQRCHNPKTRGYHNYGGRGIAVCQEWRDSFLEFYRHLGPRPNPTMSIDRIDNDGDYEPGNVKWSTRREQNLNTRRSISPPTSASAKSLS